jgi:hypothetical protein
MKVFAIIGAIVVAVWMAWATKQILTIREISLQTCGLVYADIERNDLRAHRKPIAHPPQCPFVDLASP